MVKMFKSKNLQSVKHSFFGRSGGVSTGIYSSLNLSENTTDSKANIYANNNWNSSQPDGPEPIGPEPDGHESSGPEPDEPEPHGHEPPSPMGQKVINIIQT